MTEAEWVTRHDHPLAMLDLLRQKASDRKLLLFLVGYCRQLWSWFTDERSRRAVETAERYADGLATLDEMRQAENWAFDAYRDLKKRDGDRAWIAADGAYITANASIAELGVFQSASNLVAVVDALDADRSALVCELLREVFGNPFRRVMVEPTWRIWEDGTVVKQARAIYEDRAFDRLPIVADALEDAGCENDDILAHCRGPGPHVRGCWVVDLLSGQE